MKKLMSMVLLGMTFFLPACGNSKATPTLDIGGTFTAVAETIIAGQPTPSTEKTATLQPTILATATLFPTNQFATTVVSQVVSYSYSSSSTTCDNASYAADVTIPDGTDLYPGTTYVKTWKLYNSGTCTWDEDYELTYVSGSQMSGADTALDEEVSPGEYISISITMVAPTTEGTYTGYWRMANDGGTLFGDTIYVTIDVMDDAATSTPTTTPTSTDTTTDTETEATSTTEPTNTTAPTSTTAPTEVPTNTPVPATTMTEPTEATG